LLAFRDRDNCDHFDNIGQNLGERRW
jgi:hypothetical protein